MRIAVVTLTLFACRMYGEPAQHLARPPEQPRPPPSSVTAMYDDFCPHGLPGDGPPPSTPASRSPTATELAQLVQRIEHDSAQLRQDPFNAELTLDLALTYDRTLRKGCALVMLHRL